MGISLRETESTTLLLFHTTAAQILYNSFFSVEKCKRKFVDYDPSLSGASLALFAHTGLSGFLFLDRVSRFYTLHAGTNMCEAKLKGVADALWSQGKRWATRKAPKGQLSRWSAEKWSQHICDVLFKELDAEQKNKVRHELRVLLRSAEFRRLVGDLQIEDRAQFLKELLQEFK